MDKSRRKELLEEYREMKTYMGVIQIKNTVNEKIYLAAYPNLKNKWLTIKMQLNDGIFAVAELQRDWKKYGEAAFVYEVLEEKSTEDVSDVRWEAKEMLKFWLLDLQPYNDKGYNKLKEE